jgi:uncharacterized RDD family membrane protein YckC
VSELASEPIGHSSGAAGLVSRLTALAVDVALLTVAGLAVTTLPSLAWQQLTDRSPGWLAALSGALGAALPTVYFATCWWLTGRTAGGLLVGTVVQRPDGSGLSPLRALARAFLGLVLAPVWLVGLVGVLTDPQRRAWHDRVFGTVVRYSAKTWRDPRPPGTNGV